MFKFKQVEKKLSSLSEFGFNIDYIVMYFDENGMFVRNIIYSNDIEMIRVDLGYIDKNGIFVANQIKTTTLMENMKLINSIKYNAISINTE